MRARLMLMTTGFGHPDHRQTVPGSTLTVRTWEGLHHFGHIGHFSANPRPGGALTLG
jgi:hypothetical protein